MAIVTRRGAARAQLPADLTDLYGDMHARHQVVAAALAAHSARFRGRATATLSLGNPRGEGEKAPVRSRTVDVGTSLAVPSYMGNLLWLIIVILVLMWLGGFAFHVGGGLIHLLLVIAVVVLVIRLITGRRVL